MEGQLLGNFVTFLNHVVGLSAVPTAPPLLHEREADLADALPKCRSDACRETYPGGNSEMVDTMPPPRFVPYLKVNPTWQFVGRRSVAVQGLTTGWAASDITKSSFRGFLDGAEERDRDLAALLTEIQNGGILNPTFIAGVLLQCLHSLRPCCDDLMDGSREIIKRLAGDCQVAVMFLALAEHIDEMLARDQSTYSSCRLICAIKAVTEESSDSEAYCEQVDLMRTLMSQLTGGPFFCLVLCYLSHRLARMTPWAAKHFQEHAARHVEGLALIIQQGLGEQHQTNDRDKPVNVTVNTRETFELVGEQLEKRWRMPLWIPCFVEEASIGSVASSQAVLIEIPRCGEANDNNHKKATRIAAETEPQTLKQNRQYFICGKGHQSLTVEAVLTARVEASWQHISAVCARLLAAALLFEITKENSLEDRPDVAEDGARASFAPPADFPVSPIFMNGLSGNIHLSRWVSLLDPSTEESQECCAVSYELETALMIRVSSPEWHLSVSRHLCAVLLHFSDDTAASCAALRSQWMRVWVPELQGSVNTEVRDRLIRLCRFIVMKVRPQRFEPTVVLRQLSSLVVARATEEIISAQLSERLQRAHMFLQQLNIISYIFCCCGSHMDSTRCFYMWLWRNTVSVE
jgi:hypothetical protein